ncbi:hypothetical protein F2Q70_00043900 [Brassica cretica]|uniref:Uncharacterized protein n=1 Tax=Brassica cretica TaxID=69181 RepID=A0A8S9KED6_BRACR|nr:hypothetical protein F2Q70_00043900 [Brassica cretica]
MKYKPQTLEDALHRAITFIKIEEDKAAFSKKHAATKKSSSKDKEPDEYNEPRQHYDKTINGWEMNEDGTGLAGCVSLSRLINGWRWDDGRHKAL